MEAARINPYDYEPRRNIPLDVESHGSSSTNSSENDDEHQVLLSRSKSTSMTMTMWTDSGLRTGVRVTDATPC